MPLADKFDPVNRFMRPWVGLLQQLTQPLPVHDEPLRPLLGTVGGKQTHVTLARNICRDDERPTSSTQIERSDHPESSAAFLVPHRSPLPVYLRLASAIRT